MDQSKIIIGAIILFAVSFLSMIPIYFITKKRKSKAKTWVDTAKNEGYAVVHFSGDKLKIDGPPPVKENWIGDGSNCSFHRLKAGSHQITCRFQMTSPSLGGNKNYYTEKEDYTIQVESGKEYVFELAGPSEYFDPTEFQIFIPMTSFGVSATILFGEGSISDRPQ